MGRFVCVPIVECGEVGNASGGEVVISMLTDCSHTACLSVFVFVSFIKA